MECSEPGEILLRKWRVYLRHALGSDESTYICTCFISFYGSLHSQLRCRHTDRWTKTRSGNTSLQGRFRTCYSYCCFWQELQQLFIIQNVKRYRGKYGIFLTLFIGRVQHSSVYFKQVPYNCLNLNITDGNS